MNDKTVLPLTSMDAGLLRQIAAKVDDDLIDVNDAKILRGIADSVDSVLEWCEGARSKEEVEEILFGDTQQPEGMPLRGIPSACPCGHNLCEYKDCDCYNCLFLSYCRRSLKQALQPTPGKAYGKT